MKSRSFTARALRILVPTAFVVLAACQTAVDTRPTPELQFSSDDLYRHVAILADDEFEGRGAGYPGEKMAAKYIAEQFAKMGLQPLYADQSAWRGFIQQFDLQSLDGPIPWEVRQSQNVVGVLPGSHPEDGYIVIGGHYDGQGKTGQAELGRGISEGDLDFEVAEGDNIWNSAVDNAVSIASIIEIARNLSQSKVPLRRTIVFVAFGSEESALDGSTHFANNPVTRLGHTAGMINLEKLVGDPDAEFLYVSYGTSEIFPKIAKMATEKSGVDLVPFYPGVIANTDHYAFILSGTPAITIGTGSVENVHTPSDHADHLDYQLLSTRTNFVLIYLIALANSDSAFEFTGDIKGRFGASGGPATQQERIERNFAGEFTFKVSNVVNGSPANLVGLLPGDLIIAVNDAPVPQQDFYQGLENLFDEETVCQTKKLTVNRRNKIVEIVLPGHC